MCHSAVDKSVFKVLGMYNFDRSQETEGKSNKRLDDKSVGMC